LGLRDLNSRFQQASREDLVGVHRRYFRPEGAALIVVGDVRASDVTELARRHWSDWSSPEPLPEPPAPPAADPRSTGGLQIRLAETPQRDPSVIMLQRAPAASSPSFAAFVLLRAIIDARILVALRREASVAYVASAALEVPRGQEGRLALRARVDANSTADAIGRLRLELRRLRTTPVDPAELEQAKAQYETFIGAELSTDAGAARLLATLHLWGVPSLAEWSERVRRVGVADISGAAQEYLSDTSLEVLVMGRLDGAQLRALRRIGEVTID
jgi:zinc protease